MVAQLPTWFRFLLALALLLSSVLPALAPAPANSPLSLASAATFTSPLPPPTPAPRLTLNLQAAPAWAEPGEVVTFTVTAANTGAAPLAGLTLTAALPAGLVYVAQSAVGFAHAPREQQLTWQPAAVAAGMTITGSFQARVQGLALGDTVTNTVTATGAGLVAPISVRATVDVVPPRNNEAWIAPGQGGLLRATDDRVLLRVPAGAVAGRTRFTYAPETAVPNPPPGLRFAFRLEAQDEQGQAVREFPAALELVVDYREQAVAALGLAYYAEASQRWLPIAAQMAHGRRQLRASLSHLTLFAGTTTSGPYDLAPAANVRGAQPQLYSRSIAYTYPFELPPGRGGLTPQLALTYSSANHSQQAGHFSLVGHGWNLLGADYVERNPDTHEVTLVLQGRTYTLAHSEPNSNLDNFHLGSWAVKEAPGWRVTYEASDGPGYKYRVFHIWASDGVHYQFQGNLNVSRDSQVAYPVAVYEWGGGDCNSAPARWVRLPLHSINDRHGNEIHFAWGVQRSSEAGVHGADDQRAGPDPYNCPYVRAIRLEKISYASNPDAPDYNNDRIRIHLTYTRDRYDRPARYEDADAWKATWLFFPIDRLVGVRVAVLPPNSPTELTVRQFTVQHHGYEDTSAIIINPGQARSQTPLYPAKIIEQSGGLTQGISFAYAGGALTYPCSYDYLQRISSPYGGVVEFVAAVNARPEGGYCYPPGWPAGSYEYRAQWRPPHITQRTERDTVTAPNWTATWLYGGDGWDVFAHGFARVWITQPDQGWEIHDFWHTDPTYSNNDPNNPITVLPRAGYMRQVRTCAAYTPATGTCSGEIASTETDWNVETLPQYADQPDYRRPYFARLDETRRYAASAGGRTAIQKTRYAYEPALQVGSVGAKQYGNRTRVEEYEGIGGLNFASAPLRTTTTRYYPNDSQWLVNQPAVTQVYAGTTTLFAETRYYYDNTTNHTLPPTAGLLKRVETLSVFNGAYQGNPASVSQYYEYENGNLKWVQDANGNTTTYFYDPWYKAFRVCAQNAAQQKARTTYYGVPGDGACNPTHGSALGTAGASFGQVEQVEDANGVRNRTTYDGLGRPQTVTLAVGTADQALQSYSYRPFAGIGPNAPFWVQTQQQDNAGGDGYLHTWTFYDGFGRAIETQAEADNSQQHIETYRSYTFRDAMERESPPVLQPGSVTSSASFTPLPAWTSQNATSYAYDALGRPTTVTYPDSTSQTTAYVAEGRSTGVRSITTATDEKSRQSKTEHDAFGRLRTSSVYSGTTPVSASYDYDIADRLTTVTAPGGFVTTIGYDGLGRKASVSDPDLGLWRYTYDAAGNLATQTDARGVTLWFKYDSLNRLTEKRQTDAIGSLLAQYFYDEAQTGAYNLGRRTRATAYEYRDGWGSSATLTNTLTQSYDARGRVRVATRTVDGANYTTQYAYDPADRVIGITYPDGEQVTTAYGSQSQPSSLTSTIGPTAADRTLADSASYDAANRLTSLRFPAGGSLVRRQVYYPWTQQRGRLQSLLVGTSATVADRLNLTYAYDAVGNVESISDNGILSSFGYDGLYQLTAAYGQSFGYDTAGRITNFNGLAYTPDGAHPHAVNLVNGIDRYDYDANGNQVVRQKGVVNQEQVLAYDAENRLAAVTYSNRPTSGGGGGNPPPATCNGVPCKRVYLPLVIYQPPAERYSYDADGVRIRKETQTEVTRTIGPHYEVTVGITSGQVLTTTKYYDFGGKRIAVRQNGRLFYLHGDHLGSTSVSTNNTGAKTNDVRYFAYGGQRTGNLFALPTDHTFTGQKLDWGTGLLDYGARYYDPALGLFIQPDTIVPSPGDPQSLNRYSYVLNNPLRYTDPTGMFTEDEIMKYYGVKSWDEVLAMFGEGGKLEGRWGWLQVLREAELGYTVQVMEGWNGGWFHGSVDDITVFAGYFVEQNGRLLVQADSGSSVVAADMVGLWGDGYYLAMRGSDGTDFAGRQFGANTKYWNPRLRPFSKVDWVGVGFDAAGIAADILTLGVGGRLVNGVQVSRAAGRVGAALDVASITYAGVQTGAAVVQGDWSSAGGSAVDMTLAGLGTQVPIVFDVVSLIKAFVQWSP